jgi:hypothetical protein
VKLLKKVEQLLYKQFYVISLKRLHENRSKCTNICPYLRLGSNPVINSGHGACAEDPAGVSGQHDQPSNVPGQNRPAKAISDLAVFTTNVFKVLGENIKAGHHIGDLRVG